MKDWFINRFYNWLARFSGHSDHQIKLSEKQIAEGWRLGVDKGGYQYAYWKDPSEKTDE